MGTVVTGDNPDFGWEGRATGEDGLKRGLTGCQLCHAAWAGVFDAFGNEASGDGPLVVVSLGPQPEALGDLQPPKNAVCLPEVPQVDLLKAGVDLFLTHGGQNSFTEALSAGVPLVVCPGFGDQLVNARKAEARGVGLHVPRPDPDAGHEAAAMEAFRGRVAATLQRVIAEPAFEAEAARCAYRLARAGGVPRAVQVMLAAAASGKEATVRKVEAAGMQPAMAAAIRSSAAGA